MKTTASIPNTFFFNSAAATTNSWGEKSQQISRRPLRSASLPALDMDDLLDPLDPQPLRPPARHDPEIGMGANPEPTPSTAGQPAVERMPPGGRIAEL